MRESSSTTTSYATKKLTVSIPGTATVILANSVDNSCLFKIRTTIQNAPIKNLTFINFNLREEMLKELRLKMSGILNSNDNISDNDFPLACDYFFYVSTLSNDEEMLIDVQLVDAGSGVIEWSVHLEHETCEGLLTQLARLLRS